MQTRTYANIFPITNWPALALVFCIILEDRITIVIVAVIFVVPSPFELNIVPCRKGKEKKKESERDNLLPSASPSLSSGFGWMDWGEGAVPGHTCAFISALALDRLSDLVCLALHTTANKALA